MRNSGAAAARAQSTAAPSAREPVAAKGRALLCRACVARRGNRGRRRWRRRRSREKLIVELPPILVDQILELHALVLRERLLLANRREAALLLVGIEHFVARLEQLLIVRGAGLQRGVPRGELVAEIVTLELGLAQRFHGLAELLDELVHAPPLLLGGCRSSRVRRGGLVQGALRLACAALEARLVVARPL